MDALKRLAGFVWIALAAAAIYLLISRASLEIGEAATGKRPLLDTRMFWYIIVPIFSPILLGLGLFGWYAWRGEYGGLGAEKK